MAARMPMRATTVMSSMSVNPRSWPFLRMTDLFTTFAATAIPAPIATRDATLPVPVLRAVERLAVRLAVDVVDVLAAPGGRVGIVLVAAHAPLVLAGHGIDRDPPQELQLVVDPPDLVDALHERVQVRWIALAAELHVGAADLARVHGRLVAVERRAQDPQLPAQLDLLLARARHPRERQDGRGQDH